MTIVQELQVAPTDTFDFYFDRKNYVLSKGKGISLFNTHPSSAKNFINRCIEQEIPHQSFSFSNLSSTPLDISDDTSIVVVNQDLSYENAVGSIPRIVDNIIFPSWYKGISICFFSNIDRTIYLPRSIQSSEIHQSLPEVLRLLSSEQLISILDRVNYTFLLPEYLSQSHQKTIFTPIEDLLLEALEEESIEYVPQIRFGFYTVDFLVTIGNQKVIVECDGREYHSKESDDERDKVLLKEGYPIIRFTGSEIFADAKKCVDAIRDLADQKPISHYDIDLNLDTDQIKAVSSIRGPIRALAPAGSGKTKTLTNRIAHLINQDISEDRILALAFNTKAREEMQNRLQEKGIYSSEVRTFHSFGYEIVRKSFNWKFQDEGIRRTKRNLLRKAVSKKYPFPPRRNKDPIDVFQDALRQAKMELVPLEEINVEYENKIYPFQEVFLNYIEAQKQINFMDFDDMIYLAIRALLDNELLRKEYQNRFEYILVDEYQDLNQAQLILLHLISLPENNIFVVGDDDQMIYGWRGAEIRHILDFNKRYSITKNIVLSTNYRSSKKIIRHSKWLIDHNQERVAKEINPRKGAISGNFEFEVHNTLWEQAKAAADWILENHSKHELRWNDFAILFRYNAFQFPLALALDQVKIPHSPVMGEHLFQTKVGDDVFAYLSIILHPNEAKKEQFKRILKTPNKYFTNQLISEVENWPSLKALPSTNGLREWEIEKSEDFITRIEIAQKFANLPDTTPIMLMDHLANELGLKQFYKDHTLMSVELDQASDENLLEVITSISNEFSNSQTFFEYIYKCVNDELSELHQDNTPRDEVMLSTIHKAKGKEFTNIVYFNLSEKSNNSKIYDVEEERRVAYVAVTKPKDNLFVTSLKSDPSPFLKELALSPKLKKYSNPEIQVYLAKNKRSKNSYQQEIDKLLQQKEDLESRYPELIGEDKLISYKIRLIQRLVEWYRLRRLEAASKKLGQYEEKLLHLTDEELVPINDLIDLLTSELSFRNILSENGTSE